MINSFDIPTTTLTCNIILYQQQFVVSYQIYINKTRGATTDFEMPNPTFSHYLFIENVTHCLHCAWMIMLSNVSEVSIKKYNTKINWISGIH